MSSGGVDRLPVAHWLPAGCSLGVVQCIKQDQLESFLLKEPLQGLTNIKLKLNFMSKFSIRSSDKIGPTKIRLYKLIINRSCQIDDFEEEICQESSLDSEIEKIYNILRKVCDLKMLPKTMFRIVHSGQLPFQLYEAKSKNLRFYLIKLEKIGKVIVLAGRKNNQKSDLKYLVKLVNDIHSEGINT